MLGLGRTNEAVKTIIDRSDDACHAGNDVNKRSARGVPGGRGGTGRHARIDGRHGGGQGRNCGAGRRVLAVRNLANPLELASAMRTRVRPGGDGLAAVLATGAPTGCRRGCGFGGLRPGRRSAPFRRDSGRGRDGRQVGQTRSAIGAEPEIGGVGFSANRTVHVKGLPRAVRGFRNNRRRAAPGRQGRYYHSGVAGGKHFVKPGRTARASSAAPPTGRGRGSGRGARPASRGPPP